MRRRLSLIRFFTAAAFAAAMFVCAANGQAIQVNDAPLRDFANDVQARIDKKEIDVTKPFSVEMDAYVTEDGKLDRTRSKFTSESGDPKMIEVAKQAIYAMGDSGYFGYLQQADISHATIATTQTANTFTGSVRSSQNRIKAMMVTSGVNAALQIALMGQRLPNERMVLENTRASRDGGDIDITCTLPARDFQRMILGNTAAAAPAN